MFNDMRAGMNNGEIRLDPVSNTSHPRFAEVQKSPCALHTRVYDSLGTGSPEDLELLQTIVLEAVVKTMYLSGLTSTR